jgi:uncharacterized caspase-like protein
VALDGKGRNSPYAAALVKHIVAPGDDLPTILINVRNDVMRATARRQVPWEHSAMTARFYFVPPRPTEQQIELQFWVSVKDSTSPAVLGTYLERYPSGEYATIARALIDHYDRQLKLELAAREDERRRQEEEMRAAEAKRLEDEQRARETALAQDRKTAEQAKSVQETARLEKERAELLARNEELRKALDEARVAREAAKAAEEKRLAALKAAESATKAAEETIAKKRDAEKKGDSAKVAALPKIENRGGLHQFDGAWTITWRGEVNCDHPKGSYTLTIQAGKMLGRWSGSVSPAGSAYWTGSNSYGVISNSGTFRGRSGSGTFSNSNCRGSFTARR